MNAVGHHRQAITM